MKRILAIIAAAVLAAGALECAGTPQSQCQDGSVKVTHTGGHTKTYHCHNGEWVKE